MDPRAQKIKAVMQERDLTVPKVAEITKLSSRTIREFLNGVRPTREATIVSIYRGLGLEVDCADCHPEVTPETEVVYHQATERQLAKMVVLLEQLASEGRAILAKSPQANAI